MNEQQNLTGGTKTISLTEEILMKIEPNPLFLFHINC